MTAESHPIARQGEGKRLPVAGAQAASGAVARRRRHRTVLAALAALSYCMVASAQVVDALAPQVRKYVRIDSHRVILEHVGLIDGTGAVARPDQNVYLEGGKIVAISAGADDPARADTTVLDLRGDSVMPGIVGMHNHLFALVRPNLGPDGSYDSPGLFLEMSFSAPRLYLANGVTTMRTVGSANPNVDVKLKRAIESGAIPGPHLDVTGPFLDGPGNSNLQMQELTGPEDARQTVAFWADRGVTSFKAYAHITREELAAVVKEAHRRGLKVTGHLCSVTYEEAAQIGIDNIEHGFQANTALDPGKKPDTCSSSRGDYTLEHMVPDGPDALRLLDTLIRHHVAITSTLPSLAASAPSADPANDGRPTLGAGALNAMAPAVRNGYLYGRNNPASSTAQANTTRLLRRDMDLQRAFVENGGLLLAGADPVGVGGLVPGFADHREIELLVQAGFTPVEAIKIATLNGATFLGRQDQVGSIAVGKNADLVVIRGDPTTRIADIENVEIVFKDGVGYDPTKLLDSAKGHYGEY